MSNETKMAGVKSADEWVKSLGNRLDRYSLVNSPETVKDFAERIQQDAYRAGERAGEQAGMTEAAGVLQKRALANQESCIAAILTARDAKKL